MWLRLQAAYDLRRAERRLKKNAVRRLWTPATERGRRVA
jgi:plasmid maintenance system antidote protein VapI